MVEGISTFAILGHLKLTQRWAPKNFEKYVLKTSSFVATGLAHSKLIILSVQMLTRKTTFRDIYNYRDITYNTSYLWLAISFDSSLYFKNFINSTISYDILMSPTEEEAHVYGC